VHAAWQNYQRGSHVRMTNLHIDRQHGLPPTLFFLLQLHCASRLFFIATSENWPKFADLGMDLCGLFFIATSEN
jgi:hypothetical protein